MKTINRFKNNWQNNTNPTDKLAVVFLAALILAICVAVTVLLGWLVIFWTVFGGALVILIAVLIDRVVNRFFH